MRKKNSELIFDENSALLDTESSSLRDKCASCGTTTCSCIVAGVKPAYDLTKYVSYPLIDYFRIALVTQSLIGRWLWQFFLELDRYGWAPNEEVQQTWIGWPIIAVAFTMAAIVKSVNYYKRRTQKSAPLDEESSLDIVFSDRNNEESKSYQDKKGYLALQDYVYAFFSSSIVYFLLDAVSSTGSIGSIPLGWFITTSALVPVVSFISAGTAMPDTTDQLIVKPSQLNGCPSYHDTERKENVLNAVSGAVYGANIFILFWTINREVHKQTAPLETWQFVVSSLYVAVSSILGYFLTSHPKLFHGTVASSKAMRDGALAYAALSGLAFHMLTGITQCNAPPCWGEDIEAGLTYPFVFFAVTVAVFSGLTSLFRYDDNHQSYLDNKAMIARASGKIKDVGSTIVGGIANGLSACGTLFNRCSCPCKSGNTSEEECDSSLNLDI